jgi:hypothetical protein
MKRKIIVRTSIALVFCFFVLVRLPASLFTGYLPAAIRIDGCEGTVWNGRATALGLGGQVIQQNLSWHFLPAALLRGQIGWEIQGQFRDDKSRLSVLVNPKQLEVRDLALTMPLEPFLAQDQKLKVLRFGGVLRVTAANFVSSKPFTVNAKLENFFSALTASAGPLGSYQFTLNMLPGRQGEWLVSHLDGVLNVSGQGKIDTGSGVVGKVRLRPDENAAGYLQTMLSMLPREEEAYVLNLPMH